MTPSESAYWAEMRQTVRAAYRANKPPRKAGVHLGGRGNRHPPEVEGRVAELRRAGATITEIARAVGFSTRTVDRILGRGRG